MPVRGDCVRNRIYRHVPVAVGRSAAVDLSLDTSWHRITCQWEAIHRDNRSTNIDRILHSARHPIIHYCAQTERNHQMNLIV